MNDEVGMKRTHISPKMVCEQLGIGMEPVLAFIHSQQLKAVNVSNSDTRPRWLIARTDLADFLEQRSNQPAESAKPSPRRSKPNREFVR